MSKKKLDIKEISLKVKNFFVKKKTINSSNIFAKTVLFIIILVFVNLIVSGLNLRSDLTENKRYSLSEQTKKLLSSLDKDIKVIAFYESQPSNTLLTEYSLNSNGKIQTSFVNPEDEPGLARTYGVASYGTIIVESEGKTEKINTESEAQLSGAILRLVQRKSEKIYFLTGHGEKNIKETGETGYSQLSDKLGQNGFILDELSLINNSDPKIPDDASVLVIAGPKQDILDKEVTVILDYVKNGGKLLMFFDPAKEGKDRGLNKVLEYYKTGVNEGFVVDIKNAFYGDIATPVISSYEASPIADGLTSTFYVESVGILGDGENSENVSCIAKTSKESWLENDFGATEVNQSDKETAGPICVAAALAKNEGEKQLRGIIIGDSDFAMNGFSQMLGNQDLFINSLRWVLGQDNMLGVTPKEGIDDVVSLTNSQINTIFWALVAGIPGLIGLVGITVWYNRRKKS